METASPERAAGPSRKLSTAAQLLLAKMNSESASSPNSSKISETDAEWLSDAPENLDVLIAQRHYEQAVDIVLRGYTCTYFLVEFFTLMDFYLVKVGLVETGSTRSTTNRCLSLLFQPIWEHLIWYQPTERVRSARDHSLIAQPHLIKARWSILL